MLLVELKAHSAYLALTESERLEVHLLMGDQRIIDALALDYVDGKPQELSVADLRGWLAAAQRDPYALLGIEATLPDAGRFFERLMASIDLRKTRAADALSTILRLKSLAGRAAEAERGRRAAGFVPDEQLAAIVQQVEKLLGGVEGLSAKSVHAALQASGLGGLSDALRDYYDGTRGLKGWLAGAVNTLDTLVENGRQGLLNVFTGAPDHEAQFEDGEWRNWSDEYKVNPRAYIMPETEAELCAAVCDHDRLRVVGGGHSFNDSPLCRDALISLDRYNRIEIDVQARRAKLQGGIRLRDLNKLLASVGLALPVLGSTDAQSIAGLVCTDLHGTGRDHGFLSEQILSLRIIDAAGVAVTVGPGEPLFHAAIGGLGALGVISEVELALEPEFNLRKTIRMVDRNWAEEHIDELLRQHDHLSFYYAGGADETRTVRMHTWDRTNDPPDEDWQRKLAAAELADFVLSGFAQGFIELLAEQHAENHFIELLAPEKSVIAPAGRAFGRRLFYRHDEIEHGLPFERYREALDEVMRLLERRNYFSIVEVRFTPDKSQAMIGPGVGRRTAFIELATPMSQSTGAVYAEVEDIFLKHGGQPHLGKKTNMTSEDMLKTYGPRFDELARLRKAQDPKGKFKNRFIEQVF